MKTIHQLVKLSRRIPRLRRRCIQKLTFGKKLTDQQVTNYRNRLAGSVVVQQMLDQTLKQRNIGGKPFRDARPLKVQRIYAPLVAQ